MEDLIEELTRGNVTEVKVILASVVLALAVYQLLLAAVAYGWVRLPFLESHPASWAHRASGDAIVVLTVLVAVACVSYYGFEFEDEGGAHAIFGAILLGVIALKVIAVGYGRVRPPFLASRAASLAHRAVGDVIAALLVVVAVMCLSYFGIEDDAGAHVVAASALLAVLALKILVLRRWHRLSPLLPALGACVFVLLAVTWATSAGDLLADR